LIRSAGPAPSAPGGRLFLGESAIAKCTTSTFDNLAPGPALGSYQEAGLQTVGSVAAGIALSAAASALR
jgi:hypothetical protein